MSHALYKQLEDINVKLDILLKHYEIRTIVDDLITEKEACAFLQIQRQTIRDYVCNGKLDGTYTVNVIGKRMYYKSKLIKHF